MDGLVLRYRVEETDDGLRGRGGHVHDLLVLARVGAGRDRRGRSARAQLCEKLLSYASPLGLYAEEIDPRSGRHLGNFPQAFTHLALINAVMHVIRATRGSRRAASRSATRCSCAAAARPRRSVAAADDMKAVAASRTEELAVPDMSSRPGRKVAVVSCMDTRLDLYAMLGIERGDAHIIRNAGGTRDRRRHPLAQRLAAAARHGGGRRDHAREVRPPRRVGGRVRAGSRARRSAAELDGSARSRTSRRRWGAGLARLRSSPELIAKDAIAGFIFDPETGVLRELAAGPGSG